jgi:uncharacterized protein (DUF2147 family)
MKLLRIIATLALMAAPASARSEATALTAEGVWQNADDAGNPNGWFKIYQRDGAYEGQIVKVFFAPGEEAAPLLCKACLGEQKDAPALGLTFMIGMRKDGAAYENGRILNPLDGHLYRGRMELSDDGNSLKVQVYLTSDRLGQPRTWRRVPDSLETRQIMAMPVKD